MEGSYVRVLSGHNVSPLNSFSLRCQTWIVGISSRNGQFRKKDWVAILQYQSHRFESSKTILSISYKRVRPSPCILMFHYRTGDLRWAWIATNYLSITYPLNHSRLNSTFCKKTTTQKTNKQTTTTKWYVIFWRRNAKRKAWATVLTVKV